MFSERFWVKNCYLERKILFVKKTFICKEKPVTVAKLITKIKKHNQLYFGTLVLTYCYCGDNTYYTVFFQNTGFKESSKLALKKCQSNVKKRHFFIE